MSPVIVYSTPSCGQCVATQKALDRKGIPYVKVDLSKDQEALDRVRSMGFNSAPVVTAGELVWAGFQPAMIAKLAA